ncbi:unnamed protein product [Peniophora sp. CBMAI 1063]|nr:unnamed protein product [Peniophora sp. CBMAI 1063]
MQRRITGINSDIKCLGFSSDGSRLLSGSVDGSINVWSINSEDCLKVMDDRFNHFYLPGAAQGHRQPASDWLRGSQGELLLFVPKELQGYFQHPPCQMRMSGYRFTINWDGAVHGKDWTRCYVGPHLMELIYPSRRLSATQK